jgi:putative tricarboxylic transport membrane protein
MVLSFALLVKPPAGAAIGAARFEWGRAAGLLGLMAAFALTIDALGFVVASALFLAAGFRILGERRPAILAPVAAGTALGFWIMFELLDVKLDWGVFGRLFG